MGDTVYQVEGEGLLYSPSFLLQHAYCDSFTFYFTEGEVPCITVGITRLTRYQPNILFDLRLSRFDFKT